MASVKIGDRKGTHKKTKKIKLKTILLVCDLLPPADSVATYLVLSAGDTFFLAGSTMFGSVINLCPQEVQKAAFAIVFFPH